mgnify:CR=1 FL=1
MHPLLWNLMISKNKIKLLKSLKLKKYREEYKLTIIEGLRLVEEAINLNTNINHIWMTPKSVNINQDLLKKINSKKINYDIIDQKNLKLISDTNNNQGIIAEIDIKEHFNVKLNDIKSNNIVILDNVSDPGNLGTIFRTCAWYNIKNIILTSNTVDPFNFKSLRSGMGAHFTFNFIVKDSPNLFWSFVKIFIKSRAKPTLHTKFGARVPITSSLCPQPLKGHVRVGEKRTRKKNRKTILI